MRDSFVILFKVINVIKILNILGVELSNRQFILEFLVDRKYKILVLDQLLEPQIRIYTILTMSLFYNRHNIIVIPLHPLVLHRTK